VDLETLLPQELRQSEILTEEYHQRRFFREAKQTIKRNIMTLKSYIWGIRLVALFSLIAGILAILYTDPEKIGTMGLVLFYLIVFFFLSSFFNALLLWVRKKTLGDEAEALNLNLSFRQGMLLSIFAVGLLVLQSLRLLIWWDGLLLLAGVFIIELYFLSRTA